MVSGSFRVVSDGFRWFQVVPRFSKYAFRCNYHFVNYRFYEVSAMINNNSSEKKIIARSKNTVTQLKILRLTNNHLFKDDNKQHIFI